MYFSIDFKYRWADSEVAHVFVGVQLSRGWAERDEIVAELREGGYPVVDMSENELALLHVRHLVGGRGVGGTAHERLLRFEFPERPGALRRFLELMSPSWSLTLFHYRNHGAAQGRVLAGIEVPPEDDAAFREYLEQLGYPFADETDNEAYALFLR